MHSKCGRLPCAGSDHVGDDVVAGSDAVGKVSVVDQRRLVAVADEYHGDIPRIDVHVSIPRSWLKHSDIDGCV